MREQITLVMNSGESVKYGILVLQGQKPISYQINPIPAIVGLFALLLYIQVNIYSVMSGFYLG